MTEESLDCVEMKRQIQEQLGKLGPRLPLPAWNDKVREDLQNDPHLRRFGDRLMDRSPRDSRRAG